MGSVSIVSWIIVLAVVAVPTWAWCTIVRKAGFNPWWGLLYLVPLVNLVMLYLFAFSRWPSDPPSGRAA